MSQQVRCPECNLRTQPCSDSDSGSIKCSNCGTRFRVTGRSTARRGDTQPVYKIVATVSVLAIAIFAVCTLLPRTPSTDLTGNDPRQLAAVTQSTANVSPSPPSSNDSMNADFEKMFKEAREHQERTAKRDAEELEAFKRHTEWSRSVTDIVAKRHAVLKSPIDALERALIQAAAKMDDAKQKSAAERLRQERNDFADSRLKLPKSPEVRDAVRQYADLRFALETKMLPRMQELANDPRANKSSFEYRELQNELNDLTKSIDRLKTEMAGLSSAVMTAANETASKPPTAPQNQLLTGEAVNQAVPTTESTVAEHPENRVRGWTMDIDPGPSEKNPPPVQDFEIRVPGQSFDGTRMIYARGAATFAAAAASQKLSVDTNYYIYNLQTGRESGMAGAVNELPDATMLRGPTISQDGKYLAVVDFTKKAILVGDVVKKKLVVKIPHEDLGAGILFANPTRLLALDYGEGKPFDVISLPKGTVERKVIADPEIDCSYGRLVCSPGGRYLAYIDRPSAGIITFYDLESGDKVGMIDAGILERFASARVSAISFSLDGKEFAAQAIGVRADASSGQFIFVWSTKSGQLISAHPINKIAYADGNLGLVFVVGPEPLQWFPDGKGWLIGQRFVYDRVNETVLRDLSVDSNVGSTSYLGTKVLDDLHVLIQSESQKFKLLKIPRRLDEVKRQ